MISMPSSSSLSWVQFSCRFPPGDPRITNWPCSNFFDQMQYPQRSKYRTFIWFCRRLTNTNNSPLSGLPWSLFFTKALRPLYDLRISVGSVHNQIRTRDSGKNIRSCAALARCRHLTPVPLASHYRAPGLEVAPGCWRAIG